MLGVEAAQQPHGGVPALRRPRAAAAGRTRRTRRRAATDRRTRRRARTGCAGPAVARRAQPRPPPNPGRWRTARNSLNRQLSPRGCSVSINPMARRRGSPASAWRAISPPLSWPTTATSSRSSRSSIRRTLLDVLVDGQRRVGRRSGWSRHPGRSITWQVTWSARWGSSVRKVAPLTGQPWTNSTSGPLPTAGRRPRPAPTSRNRSGGGGTGRPPRSVVSVVHRRLLGVCSGHCETIVAVTTTIKPMGHKHTKEEILDGALATAFDDGLSQLTLRAGRQAAGDQRPHRRLLLPHQGRARSARSCSRWGPAPGDPRPAFSSPAADHLALVRAAWPILARPDADPVFALFFEANGLAATGREPVPHARPAAHRGLDRLGRRAPRGHAGTASRRSRGRHRPHRRPAAAPPARRSRRRGPRRPPTGRDDVNAFGLPPRRRAQQDSGMRGRGARDAPAAPDGQPGRSEAAWARVRSVTASR